MVSYTPLQEQAYAYLKGLIINGELVPGATYSETKLAGRLGISRTPMKDALVRLSQDKYIDIIPSKGFCLHVMDSRDVWETYQARIAIEGFCALNLAAKIGSEPGRKSIRQLADCLEEMERLVSGNSDISGILSTDLQFHQLLVASAGNDEFNNLFESLNHRVSAIALDSFCRPGRPHEALSEHRAIYDSILSAGGASLAIGPYQAVIAHMDASRDIALAHLEKDGDISPSVSHPFFR